MNFELTREQRMIREEVRNFARKEVAPRAAEMEHSGNYPYDLIDQMADLGLMGIPFPESVGGMGGDWVSMHLAIEEIAYADIPLAGMLEVTSCIVAQEIFRFGTPGQQERWLKPLVSGKRVGAFGLTEPNAGSDAGALETTAVTVEGQWVLNGTKQFITNIGLDNASVVLVAARLAEPNAKTGQIATFIVPKDTPGFILGERYRKTAWHASATHEVVLNHCRIPRENLLGDADRGFAQHLAVLETGRISIAAMSVGLAQACLDESLRHARSRVQFGRSLFDFQSIQFKLADMAVAIELARNQYLKAAWMKDKGLNHTFEAASAKLFGSEMAEKAASDAVQIFGGYGFMEETPVSRYYKGAKLLQIVEGTSEVQRMLIGRILEGKKKH